ncbi:acetyl-CoA carboxylase family protein [Gordonia rhizosphera]|uniref:acetyl-CoA carboxylase n=1 Tax=Gordonia rhizosphera NBRC 16068 TaxID=1108045 RepID=K6VAA7_9ACTN|nr:carboxyl transferase domain-containing protein [Gordonia rhizosphera]GAB93143.1 putative acyl-CoA carboxylase [Gordonia rhizosphera NBRC 16068]
MGRIIVANRGEIAVRVLRAIGEAGEESVAVYARDDSGAAHVNRADASIELPGNGPAAYLDIGAVIAAAVASGADALHPGYGFLSENAALARATRDAGVEFIGPSPEVLETLGDKTAARALAEKCGIPVVPGTTGATSLEEANAFFGAHGPLMIKAAAGGGGRGMREVHRVGDLDEAYSRCASEARSAFGDDTLFVEKLIDRPRHIEVQIVADHSGAVTHLWERDCSIQRRHQKLIEVAPSPRLAEGLRDQILAAALQVAATVGYHGIGTVEFLVGDDEFWFMEANPRLQVEHTVTEEITGVDLVATQIRLAGGALLADCGLDMPPVPRGFAIQARVNAETVEADGSPRASSGNLTACRLPSGPGVRVDTAAYQGWTLSPRYDPLLAKVITRADDFAAAARRCANALEDLEVTGVGTNRSLLHAVMTDPEFTTGVFDTGYLTDRLPALLDHELPDRAGPAATTRFDDSSTTDRHAGGLEIPAGAHVVRAPMAGAVLTISADIGEAVRADGVVAVLESMKMEHAVRTDTEIRVIRCLVAPGEVVEAGAPMLLVDTATDWATAASRTGHVSGQDGDWSAEVAEISRRKGFAAQMGGPDKVGRHHAAGRLTARERIESFADRGTFAEIGALTGFPTGHDNGQPRSVLPANFVGGTARVDGRKVVLGVDDFTVRGGAGDAAIHAKQVFLEEYANEMRLPMVRLLDGQSGGGSVKMALDAGYTYVPANPGWDAVIDSLSVIPVAAACLGPTVGLGAARLVTSHFSVMVDGVGQVFTAGPPVVENATGERLTKEELGGSAVHRDNGIVERIVADEQSAFTVIRDFLSYLPTNAFELPPVVDSADPVDRREESLLSAVPRNRRQPYVIDDILSGVFDGGSVLRYAEYGGGTLTALARLDGHPVGVIAADPLCGATMSAEGAQALTRLVDLCETFHLPVVSLTDQAGMTIGLEAERRATIRHGARAIAAVYQARVPQAEVIVRRVYGVGGAGIVNRHRALRSWAWPSGDWGSLPVQGGVEAAFRAQIEAADDPAAEAQRLRDEISALGSPFRTAERFGVADIIDPRDTRQLLCEWVHDAYRVLPTLVGRPAFGTRP